MHNLKRNLHIQLEKNLQYFPVVAILGARQVGKTTLAKEVRPDFRYFDLESPKDFERITRDPDFFFEQHPKHIIIDEAQEYPELFRALRGVVDHDRNTPGRFILTGSSSPDLLEGLSDSLAGRIGIIELGTLKANEIEQVELSGVYRLFEKKLDRNFLSSIGEKLVPLSRQQIHRAWLKGGYPEPLLKDDEAFYRRWMENYRDTYVYRDLSKLFPKLDKVAYRRFLSMLAQISGTIINKSDLARAIEVDEKTARKYLDIAEGTFVFRQQLSYEGSVSKSIVKMPKGYLRDSGLRHYLQGISNLDALYEHPSIGHSFECFVIDEILKGMHAQGILNYQANYYRTRSGAEVDLILQGEFGVLPIEIKYGVRTSTKSLRSLSDFIESNGLDFGLVINQAEEACWLTSNIFQLPAGWL